MTQSSELSCRTYHGMTGGCLPPLALGCLGCLYKICQNCKATLECPDEPVSETMPKVPSGDPVLLVNIGHVATQVVVRPRMRAGVVDNRQNLPMLCRLGNFVPLVGCSHSGVVF